jgi:UDPglucose--hexose-1-phosphate uridylyltransferase
MHAYRELYEDVRGPELPLVTIFKNSGASAGTTVEHSHSDVLGVPVVPEYIRTRMDRAYSYYNATGGCVMCRMNAEEKRVGERVLVETDRHIAYCLFASLSPVHVWIVPKVHTPTLLDSSAEDLDDLASVLKQVAARVALGLGDPDFNYMLMIYPQDEGSSEALHWHLSFVVRGGPPRGFELGSRIFVNPVVPEETAAYLRGVALPKEALA